jgi:hypothetical protein
MRVLVTVPVPERLAADTVPVAAFKVRPNPNVAPSVYVYGA